jgi:hypothetical protein
MSDDRKNLGSKSAPGEETEQNLRSQIDLLQSKLNAAKIAYHNRMELDGKIPEYTDVAAIAKSLIARNYELQKLLYGEVKLKLSVAKLLRASNR